MCEQVLKSLQQMLGACSLYITGNTTSTVLLLLLLLGCVQALERLGRLEEGNVSEAFSQMSSRSAELVAARRKGCEALAARFEAPLKEAVSVLKHARGLLCC
jgi:hypothetical protein